MHVFSAHDSAKWFESALPDSISRVSVLRFLSEAIAHADAEGHDRWAVTLDDERACLVVGAIDVLAISSRSIRVVFVDGVAGGELARIEGVDVRRSTSSDPIREASCEIPIAAAPKALPLLLAPHLRLIETAVKTERSAATAQSHSPAVVDFLSDYMVTFLRQPAHPAGTAKH
jgi:hypothetical protein